ncbi:hypothetical protein DSM106972_016120 [Dulcicalothrix desertica PCC 7102]|uniref:Uncharacterized protein n=1 Tax=Dulcicalothrix desertica PCC 7102 TaxID=232991 RepID=A0A433VQR6_9CYAN|nr:hypothetical protein [Dulcicalothrix desertica]RUT08444.1 hypothetical protein DSM106972_016120 [Dulcicalothrix desertica PCC 7102]TWH40308.1 hypothetical protein CAL7102_09616 [Dulcicalothrix desertica PCC 7102]
MFGFDGNTKGLEAILREYTNGRETITHKEIRAYARCLLKILPEIRIVDRHKPKVEILLTALSASGLPHYDRITLAKRILQLLEYSNKPEDNTSDIF